VARLLDAVAPFIMRRTGRLGMAMPLPRLTLWSSTHPTVPTPAMLKPIFYVVLQGAKGLTIGRHSLRLTAGHCVATSFGLPYVGQIDTATRATPFVALGLDLDVALLIDVMLEMPKADDRWACSAKNGDLTGPVGTAFARFVELLAAPEDRGFLGRPYEAEFYYRLLQSPMGDTLRQLGRQDNRSRRIKMAADWLIANADKPAVVPDLAARSGMSLTSFHRHFKAVTGYSPLAFQRQARLLDARRLLASGNRSVSSVAYAVGYASPSQFSREYKNLFGVAPALELGGQLAMEA
jgi:AraC-like DNA-binding protein